MSTIDDTLPTFLVVGAAKSGTTAVYDWLRQHPEIFMAAVKEPHFFSGLQPPFTGPGDEQFNPPMVTTLEAYRALFAQSGSVSVRGEASPSYLDCYREAIPRIHALIPQAKIIILLRHPTARAFSEYVHLVRDGRESLTFRESLEAEDRRMAAGWRRIWAHKARGRYYEAVKAYLTEFGRENVGVWFYETLRDDPAKTYRQICQFLGVNDEFVPAFHSVNVGGIPRWNRLHQWLNHASPGLKWLRQQIPPRWRTRVRQAIDRMNLSPISMSSADRAYLDAYYSDDIARLQHLLPSLDFSPWNAQEVAARTAPRVERTRVYNSSPLHDRSASSGGTISDDGGP